MKEPLGSGIDELPGKNEGKQAKMKRFLLPCSSPWLPPEGVAQIHGGSSAPNDPLKDSPHTGVLSCLGFS